MFNYLTVYKQITMLNLIVSVKQRYLKPLNSEQTN